MERIVVAIDNEPASQRAVDWAVRRSRHVDADVRLVSVAEEFWEEPPASETLISATRARVAETVPADRVHTEVLTGPIVETLIRSSVDTDVLVLGSHRLHPVRSALTGALPLRVAARAQCITVLVPEDWTDRSGHIVVGVGDDATSRPALEFAAAEAARLETTLDIVHAWRPAHTGTITALLVADDASIERAARATLDEAVELVRAAEPGVRLEAHLMVGDPHAAMLRCGDGAELAVIGSHRRSPLTEWAVGGVAQGLLRDLPAPVAIVPGLERPEES